jgi:hypothetical protein
MSSPIFFKAWIFILGAIVKRWDGMSKIIVERPKK